MATHNYNLIKQYPGRILKCINGRVIEVLSYETENSTSSFTPGFQSDDIDDTDEDEKPQPSGDKDI